MVLVHLYYQHVQFGDFLGRFFGDYTRFAAGGYIFVSGLSIGVIFWPRVQDDRRRSSTYKSLWRRSAYILVVNYIAAVVLIGVVIAEKLMNGDQGTYADPLVILQQLRDVVFLREGGDLLPFYVIMIAISPLVMQTLRLRWGWLAVLVSSISLFTWGLWHPWALAPAQHLTFPPVLWQMIFLLGLLLGWAWPQYNALRDRTKAIMAGFCWAVAGVLFVMEYGYLWNMQWIGFGTAFTKVPLSTPETLRYLSIIMGIITTSDVLWRWINGTSVAAFVQTLGRKSLPVYVLHLWLMEVMGLLAQRWVWMGAWQLLLVGVSVFVLWLFAVILEMSAAPRKPRVVAPRSAIFARESLSGAAQ